jgi:pyridoxamine 5'-phosphate oxidase
MADNFDPYSTDPFKLFAKWLEDAEREEPNNPNAMCLSTVSEDGKPSSRMVLLKEHGPEGFVFYTNSESRKGKELNKNSYVSLCFYWKTFQRQIRIEGKAEIVPREMTENYFHSRHRGSQIASAASKQSSPLKDKQDYIDRFDELNEQYEGQDNIPCPEHWNGYRIVPSSIEFWMEGEHRMHDRFVFRFDDGGYRMDRLYP